MKLNNKLQKSISIMANCMAYNVQDTLDDIANGYKFSLRQNEKYYRDAIVSFLKENGIVETQNRH